MTLLANAPKTKAPKTEAVPANSQPDVQLSNKEKNTVLGMVAAEQQHPTVVGEDVSERRAWSAASIARD